MISYLISNLTPTQNILFLLLILLIIDSFRVDNFSPSRIQKISPIARLGHVEYL